MRAPPCTVAALEQQILTIPTKEETEDGLLHRVQELEFQSNPVPPIFRGLIGTEELKMTIDETFDPRRASISSGWHKKTKLPGKIGELISGARADGPGAVE